MSLITAPLEIVQKVGAITEKYRVGSIPYGLIWNPDDHLIYLDKPSRKAQYAKYEDPVFDPIAWAKSNKLNLVSESGKASAAAMPEPELLEECYRGPFAELAHYMGKDQDTAIETHDRGLASSIITSQTYSILQDPIVLGETTETIFPGVLL